MGEGEFGPVLMGWAKNILPKQEKTQVAVKVLLAREEEGFQPELALVDFANQMKLEYTNVATILGMCTDSEPYYIIYEYLDQVRGVCVWDWGGGEYVCVLVCEVLFVFLV